MMLVSRVRHQARPCFLGRIGSFNLVRKESKSSHFAVDLDIREPLTSGFVPTHAAILRGSIAVARDVLGVACPSQDAQVLTPTVQAIPVNVISIKPVTVDQSKNCTVKQAIPFVSVSSVGAGCIARVVDMPTPLPNPRSVGRVNDGVGRNGFITCAKGDICSDTIGIERNRDVRGGATRVTAPAAIASGIDDAVNAATGLAGNGDMLFTHRWITPSGVTPRDRSNGCRGTVRLNFTTGS